MFAEAAPSLADSTTSGKGAPPGACVRKRRSPLVLAAAVGDVTDGGVRNAARSRPASKQVPTLEEALETARPMIREITSLDDLHDSYRAVFSDVWGVVHNGMAASGPACAALSRAREARLPVVLITNSPRPFADVVKQMDGLGVPRASYDRIVTSGDVTRRLIAEGPAKVFFLGLERDLTLLDGLDVEAVGKDEAQAVVCTGPYDDENDDPEDYRDMFRPWVEKGLPFICANPDLIVERGDRLVLCAGALARVYREMGGETRISGKPFRAMYDAAFDHLADLGRPAKKGEVLALGDGLPTDVKGAEDYGLDILYVAGGIHARDYTDNGGISESRMVAYLAENAVDPKYWMPHLK